MATRTYGGGSGPYDGDWETAVNWTGDTKPGASDAAVCDATRTANLATSDSVSVASIDVQAGYTGTLTQNNPIAASGDVTFAGGGTVTMHATHALTVGGNFDWSGQNAITQRKGVIVMTGASKTYTAKDGQDVWSLTVNAGASITATTPGSAIDVERDVTVNGSLSVASGKTLRFSRTGYGSMTVGAGGALSGLGAIEGYLRAGEKFDNSAGGTVDIASVSLEITGSTTGNIQVLGSIGGDLTITDPYSSATHSLLFSAATYGGNVTITKSAGASLTILNTTNNPALIYQGNVTVQDTGGAGTLTWTPGSSTITFSGGNNQSVDMADAGTVEDTVVDKTGNTLTLTSAYTCKSFTGTAGTMDPNGQDVTTTNNCTWSSGFDFAAAADTMNGCDWVVGGNFSCDGQTLNATASWTLSVTGTATAANTTFKNCNASGGTEIDASDGTCTDGGGNTNINFGGAARTLVNGGLVGAGLVGGGLIS